MEVELSNIDFIRSGQQNQQEGLAVASIARDDPSPLPGMHRDHSALPSHTDGQTDTEIGAWREMYMLYLALKMEITF